MMKFHFPRSAKQAISLLESEKNDVLVYVDDNGMDSFILGEARARKWRSRAGLFGKTNT
jgi:hypothetical protein